MSLCCDGGAFVISCNRSLISSVFFSFRQLAIELVVIDVFCFYVVFAMLF